MTSEKNKFWDDQVAQRLEEIREHYPLEEQFAIWAYSVLTGKENLTRESRDKLIGLNDAVLKSTFETYAELYSAIYQYGVGNNVESWSKIHTKQASNGDSLLKHVNASKVEISPWALNAPRATEATRPDHEREFGLHQRILVFLPTYKKTKIAAVDKFIGKETGNVVALAGRFDINFPGMGDANTGLDIDIPEVDETAINKKSKALNPNSVSDVTGFGNDIAIEAAAMVSKLSYYFTQQAAKPNHTLALIEDIIQEAKASACQQFVENDPTWWNKMVSKPQLVPADKMPLAKLAQKAVMLPDMAAVDNEELGKDLKISDHTMQVLGAYHKILQAHKEALKAEQKRLVKFDKKQDDLISIVIGTGMSETIERTLQRLNDNMAFIKIFAANFYNISRLTAESRQNLSGIASLAAVIQTPAMAAIGQHQAYQLRRFRQFGNVINDQVTKQFGAIANDITAQNKATPDNTQKAIEAALGTMIKRLEELPDKIMPILEERTDLARTMQDKLLEGSQLANKHS
jgi:hypothetical protein